MIPGPPGRTVCTLVLGSKSPESAAATGVHARPSVDPQIATPSLVHSDVQGPMNDGELSLTPMIHRSPAQVTE